MTPKEADEAAQNHGNDGATVCILIDRHADNGARLAK